MNPYNELGVDENSTPGEIKKAYREKAKKEHPDIGGNKEKFDIIAKSYALLSNPTRKAIYDETGATEEHSEDQVTAQAKQKIMGEFDRYIDSKKDTILTDDVAGIVQDAFNAAISHIDDQIKRDKRQLDYLAKLKGRMKCHKGRNLFDLVLGNKVSNVKTVMEKTVQERKVIIRAVELLEDFEYSFDKKETDTWSGINFHQGMNQRQFRPFAFGTGS